MAGKETQRPLEKFRRVDIVLVGEGDQAGRRLIEGEIPIGTDPTPLRIDNDGGAECGCGIRNVVARRGRRHEDAGVAVLGAFTFQSLPPLA